MKVYNSRGNNVKSNLFKKKRKKFNTGEIFTFFLCIYVILSSTANLRFVCLKIEGKKWNGKFIKQKQKTK